MTPGFSSTKVTVMASKATSALCVRRHIVIDVHNL